MSGAKQLPIGWQPCVLGEISQLIRGVTYTKAEASKEPESGRVPILRAVNIGIALNFDDMVYVPAERVSNLQVLQRGDILIAASSGSIGVVGKAAALRDNWNGSFGAFCMAIRPDAGTGGRLLSYFLQTTEYRLKASSLAAGSNINNLTRHHLESLQYRLPPLAEQRRIVAKIEELFSDLDAGVAALERVKANLKRYRAAVLKAAVEGKLTTEWRKKNPPTETGQQLLKRILAERQKKWEEEQLRKFAEKGKTPPKDWKEKYQPPLLPGTVGLPVLPDGWCWAAMSQIGILDRGRSRHRPRDASFLYGGSYPFIQTGEISRANGVITSYAHTYSDAGLAQSRLWPEGTLCITIAANIAKTAVLGIQACFPDSVVGFLPAREVAVTGYVDFCIRSLQRSLESAASATAQKNINLATLQSLQVSLPPIAEQQQIVAEAERRLSVADAVAAEVERSLQRASGLRQAILKRAFEGKLVAQDPADEPAAALLERIKAQRSAASAKPKLAKPARSTRPKLSQKVWLARATIAAYAINALADQPTFGHVQLQKFLYLAQEHIGVDLQFEFEKQAAGPFDKDIYKIEFNAKQQKWFYATGNRGDAARYAVGPKIQDRLTWADRMFKKQLPDIDKLIEHLRGMNTEQAELFATIYAVWRELLSSGTPSTAENIIQGLFAWHESKKRFTRQRIEKCIKWMRERGYVPAAMTASLAARRWIS